MTKYDFTPAWKIDDCWEFEPGQWVKSANNLYWETIVIPKEIVCCSKSEPKLDLDGFEALLMED